MNGLTDEQIRELLKPLDPIHVYFDRDGLRRVKVQYVRMRLTQIFGFTGWGEEIISNALVDEYKEPRTGQSVVTFRAHVRLHIHPPRGRSTFFDGVGVFEGGQGGGPDNKRGRVLSVAQTKHMVSMGASSFALCRAALSLGDQFGGALHLDEQPVHGFIKGTLTHPFVEPEPPINYYSGTSAIPAQATSTDEEEHADPDPSATTEEPSSENYDDEDMQYHDRLEPKETGS